MERYILAATTQAIASFANTPLLFKNVNLFGDTDMIPLWLGKVR